MNHLAVDPETGDLWFVLFTYDGVANTLYHYSAASESLETFDIPASTGSELFSAIGFSPAGQLILAEGTVVTVFDPHDDSYHQVALDEPTENAPYSVGDSPYILDMEIKDDKLIYLSRMNVPAITQLDLSTGESRELEYPEEFGPAYALAVAGDEVWISSRWGVEGVSTAQTGRIDAVTGDFDTTGTGVTVLAASSDGHVRGIKSGSPEAPAADLIDVRDGGLSPLEFASAADRSRATRGLGILDYMTVDSKSGVVWFAGSGGGSIFRMDPLSGGLREYQLPVYEIGAVRCPPPNPGDPPTCPSSGKMGTVIRGLAVAPNGDLYFSDATVNRIGVIRSGDWAP